MSLLLRGATSLLLVFTALVTASTHLSTPPGPAAPTAANPAAQLGALGLAGGARSAQAAPLPVPSPTPAVTATVTTQPPDLQPASTLVAGGQSGDEPDAVDPDGASPPDRLDEPVPAAGAAPPPAGPAGGTTGRPGGPSTLRMRPGPIANGQATLPGDAVAAAGPTTVGRNGLTTEPMRSIQPGTAATGPGADWYSQGPGVGRSTTLDAVPSLPLDQSATAGSPDRFAQMPAPGTKNLAVEAVPAVQLDQAPSGAFVEWIGMGPGRAPLHQSTAAIPMAQQAPSAAMRDRVGQGALRPPSADPMSSAPSSGPVVPYYLARILPTPAEGAANAISVVGWGFLPNEVVSIWLDLDSAERARVLGAAEADANTIYRANALTIPPETLPGEHTLSAVGQTSGRLATALLFLEVAPAQ